VEQSSTMNRVTVSFLLIAGLASGATTLASTGSLPQPAPAPGLVPSKAEAYFEFLRGRQLEGEGDIDGAVRALQRAIELDASSGELRAELAALYARQSRAPEAIKAGEAALEVDPDNAEAHWVLGSVYAAMSRSGETGADSQRGDVVAKAIDHLEKAQPERRYDVGLSLTLGRLHLAARNYTRAIETLGALVQQEPGVVEAGWLLSQAYQGAGQRAEAIRVLETLLAVQPDFYRGMLTLAELYEQSGEWDKAAATLGRAVDVNPRFAELRLRQATALMNAGQATQARDLLRSVARERPTEPNVLYALSEAEREAGNLDEAEAAARRVMALEPTGLRGPYVLARVFERRHDAAQVVALLEPAVARAAASQDAETQGRQLVTLLAHLGFAYVDLGDYDRAVDVFERAKTSSGGDVSFDVYQAQAYLSARRYDRAIEIGRAARARGVDDPRLARLEAQALLQAGRADEAVALLQREVERRPERLDVHLGLANVLGESNRVDEALAVLDAAGQRFSQDVDVPFQRGVVLERNGRYGEAEAAFRQALELDATHGPSLNYLGYMLADRGQRLDEAIGFVERALQTDPLNPSYLDSLGWAYFKRGDLKKARTLLDKAAAALPRNSVVQDHHGDVLAAQGDAQRAIAAWERALAGDGEDIDREAVARKIADARRK